MDTQFKAQLHDQLKQALVKIWFKSTEGKLFFQGTGFFIHSTGYLLTAYHCVKGYEDNIIVESLAIGKQRAVVRRELSLVGADIAVLKVAREVFEFLPLGLIQSGNEIVAVGYPQPSEKTIVPTAGVYEGNINRLFEEGETPILESNAMVGHGQSGSPVYHYASQRVVGLAHAVYSEMSGGQAVRFEPLFRQWPELRALNQQAIERWEGRLGGQLSNSRLRVALTNWKLSALIGIIVMIGWLVSELKGCDSNLTQTVINGTGVVNTGKGNVTIQEKP